MKVKAIGYAYASSTQAEKMNVAETGGYFGYTYDTTGKPGNMEFITGPHDTRAMAEKVTRASVAEGIPVCRYYAQHHGNWRLGSTGK